MWNSLKVAANSHKNRKIFLKNFSEILLRGVWNSLKIAGNSLESWILNIKWNFLKNWVKFFFNWENFSYKSIETWNSLNGGSKFS